MSLNKAFIAELNYELSLTKKMLERVPIDKKDWKPHERSMTIGRLATHIAENPGWITEILSADEHDFMVKGFQSHTASTTEELISIFQNNFDNAIASLEGAADEDFSKPWAVKRGEHVIMQSPKKVAIRGWAFSHMIHHRGQLSVYLRLLDIPIPGMYGPTADER